MNAAAVKQKGPRVLALPQLVLLGGLLGALVLEAGRGKLWSRIFAATPNVLLAAQIFLLLTCAAASLWLRKSLQGRLRKYSGHRSESCGLCRLLPRFVLWALVLVTLTAAVMHYSELTLQAEVVVLPRALEELILRQQLSLLLLLLAGGALGWLLGKDLSHPIASLARRIGTMSGSALPNENELYIHLASPLAEVEKSFNRLASRMRRDLRRLQEFTEHISQIDRLRSRFLAGFSHELRTPLNTIIGYADLFLSGMAGGLGAEAREYLQIIMQEGEKLLEIINRLLYLSRLDAGREPLDVRSVSTRELLSLVEEQLGQLDSKPHWQLNGISESSLLWLDVQKIAMVLAAVARLGGDRKSAPAIMKISAEANDLRITASVGNLAPQPDTCAPDVYLLLAQALSEKIALLHGGSCRLRREADQFSVEICLAGARTVPAARESSSLRSPPA